MWCEPGDMCASQVAISASEPPNGLAKSWHMNISLPAGTVNEVMRMVTVSSVTVTPPSEGGRVVPPPSILEPPSVPGGAEWLAGEHPARRPKHANTESTTRVSMPDLSHERQN